MYVGGFCSITSVKLRSFNLPVGMQIIGKRFEEKMVLKAAKDFEEIKPWRDNYSIPFNRKIK